MVAKIQSIIFALGLFTIFILPGPISAQSERISEERLEAKVDRVIEEKEVEFPDPLQAGGPAKQLYQKLELIVTKGSVKDQKIIVENGNLPMANIIRFQTGDKVVVSKNKDLQGNDLFYITDQIRRAPLLWLFIIFAALTILIGRKRGVASLVGLGISFLVIFYFIFPKILSGNDPVFIAILGSLLIVPTTFYLSHGFNRKTTTAIVGTVIAIIITGVLSGIFVEAAKLTGFVSEEAGFLQVLKDGVVNIKGLLLAGIIIGVLGVLDDVTVAQSAVVGQLKVANSGLKAKELYRRAMDVGRDHIASMVNTLVLVYAGASLPLLLLFVNNPHPFSEVINYEIVASEVIRTLVGSIGLILAVPITTMIAAASFSHKTKI